MVGLPARGKSFISQKIVRYLSWLSINAKCFNVGNYRRQHAGAEQPNAEFFDFGNKEAYKIRQHAVTMAVEDMMNWFNEKAGVVAILDATNSTSERREWILKLCRENAIEPMFLESWCDDQDLILRNISEVKTTSPDYQGVDPDVASRDFLERISKYETVYEPVSYTHLDVYKRQDLGRSKGFSLVGIEGSDIVDGNKLLTLGLVWQLMRRNISITMKTLSSSGRDMSDAQILKWAQDQVTKGGKNSTIRSFKDQGLSNAHFLLDVLNGIAPGYVDYDLVTPGNTEEERYANARLAISIARKLGALIWLLLLKCS